MQKVLTASEMRDVDRLTVERTGIPSVELMEHAAQSVATAIADHFSGHVVGRRFLILCGKGNNGGDGAALARLLWTDGADVEVLLFGRVMETHGDARINFELLLSLIADENATKLRLTENADSEFEADGGFDAIVDAVFGTGLTRPVDESLAAALQSIVERASSTRPVPVVFAVDMPSGVFSDDPRVSNPARLLRADTTVTFTAPKLANVLPPASNFGGRLIVADIGSPASLIDEQPSRTFVAEAADAAKWLRQTGFSSDSYKNKRGHALIVAGSRDYAGAAVLAGNAAMISGGGLVTVATPTAAQTAVASRVLAEVIVRAADDFSQLTPLTAKADALLAGCGMTTSAETREIVTRLIADRRAPLVLDADALNTLAPFDVTPDELRPLILTPHEGEFKRLTGLVEIVDRVGAARDFSTRYKATLVLKGERTLVAAPDGRVVIIPTGNPGLGKAGNGDTLAGFIVGCLAQAAAGAVDVFETVVAAVFIAGTAGDIAARKFGQRTMLASDVRSCIADAFAELEK